MIKRINAKVKTNEFGECIRNKREEIGMGLRELARAVDLSSGYLSQLESGDARPPSEAKILALAARLKLDPDELLQLAGKIPSDILAVIQSKPSLYFDLIRSTSQCTDVELHFVREKVKAMVERLRRGDFRMLPRGGIVLGGTSKRRSRGGSKNR